MKFLLLFFLLLAFTSCTEKIEVTTHFDSFKLLKKHFREVPGSYKTVPFWVWNTDMEKDMIDERLADFSEKGYGGVFVHPRYGLITEYGSDEWYDLVAYTVKMGKRLGLDIWLYDENSFPSGFAGGIVPAEMPSSYNEGHALKMHRQDYLEPDSEKDFLLVFSETQDGLRDVTSNVQDFYGKNGNFVLFEKVYYPVRDWYAGFSYVDLIKPGVTQKFIDVTMTGYEERFLSDFGKSVPGIFTDEPNIAPQGSGDLIRWTPDLFERFEERWGYRLEPHLHLLIEESSMSGQVRHNYYQLLLELFIERWSKPWYNYTEENALLWTGHYWEHGWPSPHHGPDHMAMYAWHQVPGIDMLFNNWKERPDQFGNIRAVRELNSVGNQLGKVRKLSETYGASGWELTFEDMKRNGDWEYVLGVNLMNQHLSYQSLAGDRKHDFPQSFSYHVPYWEEITSLNEYYGRLSLALSSGKQVNRTLVLEPTTSAWMDYAPGKNNIALSKLNEDFADLLNLLENENIEYDLGSENIISQHGFVNEELFAIGEQEYNFIVIPAHLTNLNSETAKLLERYLDAGGLILSLCEPPEYIDGLQQNTCQQWPEAYPDQWLTLSGCNDPRFINYLRTYDFMVLEQQGDSIFHMRRQLEDGQLLFLANSAKKGAGSLRINMRGMDMVEMDPFTGDITNYPCVVSNEILSFSVSLEPAESKLLFIGENEVEGWPGTLRKWNGNSKSIDVPEITAELNDQNALTLDYCVLIMDEDTSDLQYFYNAQTAIFKKHGFEKNPWVSASQYKTEIIDRDTFSTGSGFQAIFPFTADSSLRSDNIQLVLERPDLYEVYLNNEPLTRDEKDWWLDKDFGVFNITGKVRPGQNHISIETDPMSVFCELEPVYIIGSFDVIPEQRGWALSNRGETGLGSWKDQGMPFYSGKVKYSAEFSLDTVSPVKIIIPDWNGTVMSVVVNGKRAGQIFAKPYELRLDRFVKQGSNIVEVTLFGSLKNLLGPHHNVSRRGIVTPWSFKYAPSDQPPGANYDLLDYGLMQPFEIYTLQ
ncbi:MAG: hypothetical protein K9J30_14370 [Bacteroidales bacterium]|nr:hypothetical protein [Bacteroidales bacterium]